MEIDMIRFWFFRYDKTQQIRLLETQSGGTMQTSQIKQYLPSSPCKGYGAQAQREKNKKFVQSPFAEPTGPLPLYIHDNPFPTTSDQTETVIIPMEIDVATLHPF